MIELSIVIPTYNERENIPILIHRIASGLKEVDFELVFFDDASTDGTQYLIEHLCQQFRLKFTYISAERHIGQHASIRRSIAFAQGNYICVMSADLQEPIPLIRQMFVECSTGADLVIATRNKRQDNLITDIGAQLFNSFLHRFLTPVFPSSGYDFYIFHSELRNQIDLNTEHFSYPQLDLLNCATKIAYVEYDRVPRIYGKTKWTFWQRLELATRIIRKYF